MKVIQNFSSRKHIKKLPLFDIMIWFVGLTQLKQLGYKTKLYCEQKDFEFLKAWGLYDLYDEIDDKFLSTLAKNKDFNAIDGVNFWSARKLFCIDNEFKVSKEPFIYMDTDIVLLKPLVKLNKDCVVRTWCEEHEPIYIPWEFLSTPKGYTVRPDIMDTNIAYNCGILEFRSRKFFTDYFNEYLAFTKFNPCKFVGGYPTPDEKTARNVWACNAEQRLLAGLATEQNAKVQVFMNESNTTMRLGGFSEDGIHYYLLRGVLRTLYSPDSVAGTNKEFWLGLYNNQIEGLLDAIKATNKRLFYKFVSIPGIYDLYENDVQLTEYI